MKQPGSLRIIPLLFFFWAFCSMSLLNAQSKDELRQEIARLRNDSLAQNKLWKTQIQTLTETISDQKRSLSQLQEYANGLQVSIQNLKADSVDLSMDLENSKKLILTHEERCTQQKSELLVSLDSVRNELSNQNTFPFFDTSSQNYVGKKIIVDVIYIGGEGEDCAYWTFQLKTGDLMVLGPVDIEASAVIRNFLIGLRSLSGTGQCFQFTMMYRESEVYAPEGYCGGYPTGRYEYQWDIVAIDKGPCLFDPAPSGVY